MEIVSQVRESVLNLFSAKLRSFLAILGVLVGTGSVVALISSSQLATSHALEQFKTLGTNLLSMVIEDDPAYPKTTQTPKLQLKDVEQLSKVSAEIVQTAPYVTNYQTFTFKGQTSSGEVVGVTQAFTDIAKIEVTPGRTISFLDQTNPFCVIGTKVADKMRNAGVDPLNQQIRIGNTFYTVIGVAKPWQPNFFLFMDMDSGALVPIRNSFLMSKNAEIRNLIFRLIEKPNLPVVQVLLTKRLKEILPSKKADFRTPQQIIDIVGKQRQTFTWLLASIGGISLIVGGIGVMNIMLVSVVERRREIGVRMAIGAHRFDILQMFLIEAIILTLFGGLLGIAIGTLISWVLAFVSKWEYHFFILPPLLGFIVSVLVGILSGFYPALHASSVDPIKSLSAE